MSDRLENFPALLAELRPQCEALIAQYEQPRSALLPVIHLFQSREGFASPEAQRAVAEMLDLTPAVVESTVSFYTLFFRKPVGKYVLQVCRGLPCSINGAREIAKYFHEKLGIGHLQTTADGLFSYEEVECLAACDKPTCMQVNLDFVYSLTPAAIDEMLVAMRAGTYATAPMVQTEAPGKSWQVKQDSEVSMGLKSKGATGVSDPNNAGGLGDKAGVIMLDRIVERDFAFRGRTNERVVREDPQQIKELVNEDAQH
ncbi:MAG: NAD(P)H-dependent oxidoreductase subunit E [Candidatus Eremiobacteraeota bacterium]|nr:NAD(P)H-dependent oxidoreductase subunit E [Candidatus Eremiobacteraeota bacterium]